MTKSNPCKTHQVDWDEQQASSDDSCRNCGIERWKHNLPGDEPERMEPDLLESYLNRLDNKNIVGHIKNHIWALEEEIKTIREKIIKEITLGIEKEVDYIKKHCGHLGWSNEDVVDYVLSLNQDIIEYHGSKKMKRPTGETLKSPTEAPIMNVAQDPSATDTELRKRIEVLESEIKELKNEIDHIKEEKYWEGYNDL